jgi:tryptophan 2,3-dioxygenase
MTARSPVLKCVFYTRGAMNKKIFLYMEVPNMTDTNPGKDSATTSFSKDMSYADYLSLDPILGAQRPKSAAHDEMLFIIQHQTSELWMRLCLHELSTARTHLINQEIEPAMKMLTRVARIFEQLNNAWDVLRTMTPSEYTQF